MNEFIGEITLDLDCRKTMPKISAGQFDKGRKYLIHITANGSTFLTSGSTVIIQGIHQDKSRFSAPCSLDNEGNVILVLSEDILSVSGFAYAKLVLSDSNKNYSTQVFIIDVDGSYEGDITADENYSIVNDFMNKLMTLFDLESPSDMLNTYPCIKEISEADLDIAVDRNTIYDVYSETGNHRDYLYRVMCISDSDSRVQYRFSANVITARRNIDTRIQGRNVVNNTWLAWSDWTSITADDFSPTAAVSKSGSQATITITDKNGTTTATISDGTTGATGPQGPKGDTPTAAELADDMYDELELDDYALKSKVGYASNYRNSVPAGQYYYTSDRKKMGIKVSEASQSSTDLDVVETYTDTEIDTKLNEKETVSNKSNNFSFYLTPTAEETAVEENQYPTVAQLKRFLSGTYYDIDEINAKIGNIETLLSQV